MELPLDYVIQNIYTYCKRPQYRKNEGIYNAECCVCKEGASSGTKRRLFYFPSERYFYCFNCAKSWSELNWLTSVTGLQTTEILKETSNFVTSINVESKEYTSQTVALKDTPFIPPDSIDIFDKTQCAYFKDKKENVIITQAVEYSKQRKLATAINRPKSLFVSPSDYVHSNRLIIPFYGESGKIETYQSRSLRNSDYPKYLTKYGEKCFFGESNIDSCIPYLFIVEGPIDAMFIQNGLGIGGAKVTERQEQFLQKHFDKTIVYIYDNDADNAEMQKTIHKSIKQGKSLFIWPKELKRFKDLNEVCCQLDINSVSTDFIIKNTFTGVEATVKYKLSLL